MPWAISEPRIEDIIDVSAQGGGIDVGELGPTPTELIEGSCRPWEGDELGDGLAVASDRQSFAALGAFDDLTSVVPQIPDRDVRHSMSVSRVIRRLPVRMRKVPSELITS
jgi:hypothetical protein